jgi:hypothetical protein
MTAWESWQSAWAGASGALPDVRARAETEARRHRRARITVWVLLAGACLAAVPAFTAPENVVHLIGWGILGFCVAMGIGYLLTHRRVGSPVVDGPRAALGFLERRLDAEQRVAHLARWVYLAACVLGAVATHVLYEEHGSGLPVRVMTLGCFVFGFALTFSAPWWFGRITRRRQGELDAWRRWMDEQSL